MGIDLWGVYQIFKQAHNFGRYCFRLKLLLFPIPYSLSSINKLLRQIYGR